MTDSEYKEWFKENLGDIESLYNADVGSSPFAYVPRPLRRGRWLILCVVGLIFSLGISFGLAFLYEAKNFWFVNWCSNAFLNLAFGLTASLIVLSYTNLRDKNVAFYSDIIPKMETQIDKMRNAYYSYTFKVDREYRKGNYESCYEAWFINLNTCLVILEYLRFLNTVLPSELKLALPQEENIRKAEDSLLSANENIQKEFFSREIICEETKIKCIRAAEYGMFALDKLDQLLITIKQSLYGLKYNKSRNKSLKKNEVHFT